MAQIAQLHLNIQRNVLAQYLLIGFSQTTKSEIIREYFDKGKELSINLIDTFGSILKEADIAVSTGSGLGVTSSTEAPFSDKLMLNFITVLNGYGNWLYSMSAGSSIRNDILAIYTKIIAETTTYGLDGIRLSIKFGFIEEPPKANVRSK